MLKLNVIRPVDVPTEWCFGLTIAFKADGKIRMCVDLTMLNCGVQRELYPLPCLTIPKNTLYHISLSHRSLYWVQ